jgi:SAM-dependent methyltransferase
MTAASSQSEDPSLGWDSVADRFIAIRSDIGADVVRRWSRQLPRGGAVADVGCGSGAPIAAALVAEGFEVCGIDPSPTMLGAFQRRFPSAQVACEPAETSRFFDRTFDGVVAIGVMFLLPEAAQGAVIARVAQALRPGGRFLFSAPAQACEWADSLTGRPSRSLGGERYQDLLAGVGLRLRETYLDSGQNHYFEAVRGG